MDTFRDIIAAWPSLEAVAADAGTSVGAVKQWRNRNNIPGEYWLKLEMGARERRIPGVTMHSLGRLVPPKRSVRPENLSEVAD